MYTATQNNDFKTDIKHSINSCNSEIEETKDTGYSLLKHPEIILQRKLVARRNESNIDLRLNKNILKHSFSSIYYTANSYCDNVESCEIDDDWSEEFSNCELINFPYKSSIEHASKL